MQSSLTGRLTSSRGGAIAARGPGGGDRRDPARVYITHYRSSVKSDTAPTPVLVAKRLIPAGTTGIEDRHEAALRRQRRAGGARSRPAQSPIPARSTGSVAATDIYPGQQMTAPTSRRAARATGGVTRVAAERQPARRRDPDRRARRQSREPADRRPRRHLPAARRSSSGHDHQAVPRRTSRCCRSTRAATPTEPSRADRPRRSGARRRRRALRVEAHGALVRAAAGERLGADARRRRPATRRCCSTRARTDADGERRSTRSSPSTRASPPTSIAPSLPSDGDIRLTGVVEGLEAAARSLEDTPCDVLVVACAGYSDRVLFLVENAVTPGPEAAGARAQRRLAERVRPPRVRGRGGRHPDAAADRATQIRFAIQKVIARRQGGVTGGRDLGRLIVVLGPKGGTGKTLVATNLAVALQEAGKRTVHRRPRPPVRRRRPLHGPQPGEDDLRPRPRRGRRSTPRSSTASSSTHSPGVKALLAPSRPDQASVVTVELVREVYALLRPAVRRHRRRHAARLHARGDRLDRHLDRPRHGRDARLAVAQEHQLGLETLELMGYDREDDIRSSSTAPTPGSASRPPTSSRCSAARRRCSSRATARSRARSTKACRS